MGNLFLNRIVVDNKVHFGKPCIAGTRITIDHVLELVEEGIQFNQIVEDYYPDLSIDDIKACIEYAKLLVQNEEIYVVAV